MIDASKSKTEDLFLALPTASLVAGVMVITIFGIGEIKNLQGLTDGLIFLSGIFVTGAVIGAIYVLPLACAIGFPLFMFARRRQLLNISVFAAAGAVVGLGVGWAIFVKVQSLVFSSLFLAVGLTSSMCVYLVLRLRAMRR